MLSISLIFIDRLLSIRSYVSTKDTQNPASCTPAAYSLIRETILALDKRIYNVGCVIMIILATIN